MAGFRIRAAVNRLVSSLVAAFTVSNTVVETTLGTVTVPSAQLVAGAIIHVRCSGFFARDGAAATVQFTPKFDGNQLENLQAASANTGGEWVWDLMITIRTAGVGGTYNIEGKGGIDVIGSNELTRHAGNGEDPVDTTSDVDFTITGQMGAANAANNMSIQSLQAWVYPPPAA